MAGKPQKAPTFEAALAELEQVVAEMEAGQLPLEEALASYRRGTELLQQCRARLEDAQQQVRILEEGALKSFAVNQAGAGNTFKRDDA
ncbi:MAG: exodeoxyribonuclease VII small subunit [Gallionellaceae bacterium]|jgi:exodeoxyribonuclease VII small subunit|nr:MAG: exodeoxyribonuclease VII small subunit [Gallionellaceae bacterium]